MYQVGSTSRAVKQTIAEGGWNKCTPTLYILKGIFLDYTGSKVLDSTAIPLLLFVSL